MTMKLNNTYVNFWKDGNGRNFIEWAGKDVPTSQNNSNLFYQYDEEVDVLVKKWMKNDDFKTIMKSLHSGTDENLPQDYLDFKKNLETKPDWLDEQLIKVGSELSERSGLIGLLVLRNFALLGGYNFANLTKPLVATGSLDKGAVTRLHNTLNFWVNISRTAADSQNRRINACLSTRLVHSASRLMIQEKMPYWDREKYGIAINYADMVATNIAFTVYYLFGLKKLNFKYSQEEEKGIFHLWKYVTYLLGVPLDIIPNNKEEALGFFKFWTQYQNAPDEDSMTLTNSLLNENRPISLLKLDIVKRNMGYIHRSIANYLIDEETRNSLNIPPVRFKNIIPKTIQLKNEIQYDRDHQIKIGNTEQLSVLADYKNSIV